MRQSPALVSALLAAAAVCLPSVSHATKATGGTVTHFDEYALHTFTSGTNSFVPSEAITVDLLLVAGGGAGGSQGGGGGGAGQVVCVSNVTLEAGVPYTVVVGHGGTCPEIYDTWEWNVANGGNGGNSSFGDIEGEGASGFLALGGGGGGGWCKAGVASANSGGSSLWCGSTASTLAEGGHAGGGTKYGAFGGGAGAGADGGTPLANEGPAGDGGAGVLLDFTGVPTWYAGGGGASGGASDSAIVAPGKGGSGIGGNGSAYNSGEPGGDAVPGTGSGGGGGSRGPNDTLRMCGGAGGSGIVIVRYVDSFPETVAPRLGTPSVTGLTPGSAMSSILVIQVGSGSTECRVSFAYGALADHLTTTNFLATAEAGDRVSVPIDGLSPGHTYYGRYFAENAQNGLFETEAFLFQTPSEAVSSHDNPYAGLIQARYGDGTDYPYDFDIRAVADATRIPGAVMANFDKVSRYVNPFDGLSYQWPIAWNDPAVTFGYDGYIYLDSALTYTFGVYVDEFCYLYIDGALFFNRVGGFTTKNYEPETTGWHSFRLYIPGGFYDKGPRGKADSTTTWDNTLGLAYRTDGGTAALPQSAWKPLVDDGSGQFLCTTTGYRTIALDAWTFENGALDASLSFGVYGGLDATLVACYGTSWGGDDFSAWTQTENLATVTSADSAYTVTALSVPATARYVRFALRFPAASGIETAWSETAALADASLPAFTEGGVTTLDGDYAVIGGAISALGAGATEATVTVEYGPAGGATTQATATYTAPGPVSVRLDNLVPETTYSYRILVANDQGGIVATLPQEFTTPGASVIAQAVSSTQAQQSVTLAGSLTTLGAGTTTLYLRMGPDAESLETVATQTATEAGIFTFVQQVAYSNSYAYAFVFTNSCAGQTWSGESNLGTFDCRDASTYYWKNGDGFWDDRDHWWSYSSGDIVGYPTFGANGEFQKEASNTVVHVRQPERFAQLVIGSPVPGLRFVADTPDASLTFAELPNWNGKAEVEFDGLPIQCSGTVVHGPSSHFVFSNGTAFEASAYNANNSNAWLSVTSGATVSVLKNLSLGWSGSLLTLDNATLTVGETLFFVPDQTPAGMTGATLRLQGTSPALRVGKSLMCYKSDRDSPTIVFDIPKDGYTTVPITITEGNDKRMGNSEWPNSNVPIILSVDPDSKAVNASHSPDYLLVDWSNDRGILTNSFVFGTVPNPNTDYLYYRPADAEFPTQIWAHVVGNGNTLILLR